jgi:hypothetical protein
LSITASDVKKEKTDSNADDDLLTPNIPVLVVPLLQKRAVRPVSISTDDGRTVKNFKRFQKVLPNYVTGNVTMSGDSHNVSRTSFPFTMVAYREPLSLEDFHTIGRNNRSGNDDEDEELEEENDVPEPSTSSN